MKESKRSSSSASKEVTEVISRNIIRGHEKDYDNWIERFMRAERQFPGYIGTTIIAHEDDSSSFSVRYIINRFKNEASLDAWENSEQAVKLLEEVKNYTTRHYERATGLETWFSLPRLKGAAVPPPSPPPRWKMAIVSFIGAYCISSLAQRILNFYLGQMPLLINLLMTVILVLGLTYFAMPLLSRLFRGWLYPRTD